MNKPSEETMRRVAANLLAFTLDAALNQDIVGPVILSDEEIEGWGRFYVENNFHARGILFETFMLHPMEISQAALFPELGVDPDLLPLLPKQRDVAQRVRLEECSRQCGKSVRANSRPLDASDLVFLKRQAD